MFYPKMMTAGLYEISSGLSGVGIRERMQSIMPWRPLEVSGRGGRMLLQNVGSLTQAQFIVVIIGSVVGFLIMVALILMVIVLAR